MLERVRRNIPEKERQAIFQAWNNKCAYCEVAPAEAVDHIVPFSKGGECELENFAAACARCNTRKLAHDLPAGYLAIIQAIALDKAPRIRKKLEQEANKTTQTKKRTTKKKQPKKAGLFCIRASRICDWSDSATYIIENVKQSDKHESILCFITNQKEKELVESAYAFNIVCQLPTGYKGNALDSISENLTTGEVVINVRKEFMPFLQLCAKAKPKKGEIIEIPITDKNILTSILEEHEPLKISEKEYELIKLSMS